MALLLYEHKIFYSPRFVYKYDNDLSIKNIIDFIDIIDIIDS